MIKPEIFQCTIQRAAEKWPKSMAHAFLIGDDINSYYFRIGEIEFLKHHKNRSRVQCLKLRVNSGLLVLTTITIQATTIINPLSIKQFIDKIHSCMTDVNPYIGEYYKWGFKLPKSN